MTRVTLWGAALVLAGALAGCSSSSGPPSCSLNDPAVLAQSPWPKFRHDLQNTGSVTVAPPSPTPGSQAQMLWTFPPPGPGKGAFAASPVINATQTLIYIGSTDHTLYAVNIGDGTQNTSFNFTASEPITGTALLAVRDGGDAIFVGAGDGIVHGLTATGTEQATNWPTTLGSFISASPTLVGEGGVYVGSLGGIFVGVCPNGVDGFALSTIGVQSSAAAAPDTTLYFGADDHQLRAVRPDGILQWTFSTGGPIVAAPVFDTDTNSIYVADRAGGVFKVGKNGLPDTNFKFTPVGPISSSPALAGSHLYFGSDDGTLYAVDKHTGQTVWMFATGKEIVSSPAVITLSAGTPPPPIVVVGSNDGNVYFLQYDGTSVTQFVPPFNIGAAVRSSPAVGGDGTIYVGADDGHLYAIGFPLS